MKMSALTSSQVAVTRPICDALAGKPCTPLSGLPQRTPRIHRLDSSIDWNTDSQREFWNEWDSKHLRNGTLGEEAMRRGNEVLRIISSLDLKRPRILEIGCGNGWLAERLLSYEPVTGVDIADAAIEEARANNPSADFRAGDIFQMNFPANSFDLIVTLETFSHVSSQPHFIELASDILSDRGYLIMTTQNRSVYTRNSQVQPPLPGQIRRWVTLRELRALLSRRFDCLRAYTMEPGGDQGLLRYVNSYKLTTALARIFSKEAVIRMKERLGFGQTLVALARKRA